MSWFVWLVKVQNILARTFLELAFRKEDKANPNDKDLVNGTKDIIILF